MNIDHIKLINDFKEILIKERETGTMVNSRFIQELKSMIEGVQRRLDILNGRTAKLENITDKYEEIHTANAVQLALVQQQVGAEKQKVEGISNFWNDILKFVLFAVIGASLALIIK